jgi:cytochrome P450
MLMYIIADQFGIPRDMHQTFKRWSDSILMIADVLKNRQPLQSGHPLLRHLRNMPRFRYRHIWCHS